MTAPIDPVELESEIEWFRRCWIDGEGRGSEARNAAFDLIATAAMRYAESLPRFKEVEVEGWILVHRDGDIGACVYANEERAAEAAGSAGGLWTVTRLTGTAKVPA